MIRQASPQGRLSLSGPAVQPPQQLQQQGAASVILLSAKDLIAPGSAPFEFFIAPSQPTAPPLLPSPRSNQPRNLGHGRLGDGTTKGLVHQPQQGQQQPGGDLILQPPLQVLPTPRLACQTLAPSLPPSYSQPPCPGGIQQAHSPAAAAAFVVAQRRGHHLLPPPYPSPHTLQHPGHTCHSGSPSHGHTGSLDALHLVGQPPCSNTASQERHSLQGEGSTTFGRTSATNESPQRYRVPRLKNSSGTTCTVPAYFNDPGGTTPATTSPLTTRHSSSFNRSSAEMCAVSPATAAAAGAARDSPLLQSRASNSSVTSLLHASQDWPEVPFGPPSIQSQPYISTSHHTGGFMLEPSEKGGLTSSLPTRPSAAAVMASLVLSDPSLDTSTIPSSLCSDALLGQALSSLASSRDSLFASSAPASAAVLAPVADAVTTAAAPGAKHTSDLATRKSKRDSATANQLPGSTELAAPSGPSKSAAPMTTTAATAAGDAVRPPVIRSLRVKIYGDVIPYRAPVLRLDEPSCDPPYLTRQPTLADGDGGNSAEHQQGHQAPPVPSHPQSPTKLGHSAELHHQQQQQQQQLLRNPTSSPFADHQQQSHLSAGRRRQQLKARHKQQQQEQQKQKPKRHWSPDWRPFPGLLMLASEHDHATGVTLDVTGTCASGTGGSAASSGAGVHLHHLSHAHSAQVPLYSTSVQHLERASSTPAVQLHTSSTACTSAVPDPTAVPIPCDVPPDQVAVQPPLLMPGPGVEQQRRLAKGARGMMLLKPSSVLKATPVVLGEEGLTPGAAAVHPLVGKRPLGLGGHSLVHVRTAHRHNEEVHRAGTPERTFGTGRRDADDASGTASPDPSLRLLSESRKVTVTRRPLTPLETSLDRTSSTGSQHQAVLPALTTSTPPSVPAPPPRAPQQRRCSEQGM